MPLWGLVVAGGRSSRMGTDKALLQVHGLSQLDWTVQLLAPFCQCVQVSVRVEQIASLSGSKLQLIPDSIENSGPLAGILAALSQQKNVGWLVVACDMPWLDPTTLELLVSQRDRSRPATAFIGSKGPEPLCAIWEPAALKPLASAWSAGQRSPRKILEQLPIQRLTPNHPQALQSINTPEQLEQARRDFS